MTPLVWWLWTLSLGTQAALWILVIRRGHFRRIPLFTLFLTVDLCLSAFLFILYASKSYSLTNFWLYWMSEGVVYVAEALAVVEVCRLTLRPYRGIWAFAWRMCTGTAIGIIVYAAAKASGNFHQSILYFQTGLDLAVAVGLVGFFMFLRYYSVPVPSDCKAIALGFCLSSCVTILHDMVLLRWLYANHELWNISEIVSYWVVLLIWIAALRKPLPAAEEQPVLLPASVYAEYSPLVHARLQLLNERLASMLRA